MLKWAINLIPPNIVPKELCKLLAHKNVSQGFGGGGVGSCFVGQFHMKMVCPPPLLPQHSHARWALIVWEGNVLIILVPVKRAECKFVLPFFIMDGI